MTLAMFLLLATLTVESFILLQINHNFCVLFGEECSFFFTLNPLFVLVCAFTRGIVLRQVVYNRAV
jgi:hypothetical protein